MFTKSTLLDFTGKKLALWFIAYEFIVGNHPRYPYVHLVSTRHHARDRCSKAFTVFHLSSTSVYYTKRKLKNKKKKSGVGLGTRLHCYHIVPKSCCLVNC